MTRRAYPEYKPSGVDWLGDVPTNWKVNSVRHIFANLDHKRIPLSAEERSYMEKLFPYYGASGVIDSVDDFIFSESLILVAEDGANLLSRSTPLAFIARGKYWVNNHAHILRPLSGSLDYWEGVLQSYDYSPLVSGSAQPKLTSDNLKTVSIPVPPESEQRAIAAFLDRETARIDGLIAKKERQIELLQEKRAALISHAVTKGLDPKAPMKPSGIEWLGDVPSHWEVHRAKVLFREVKERSETGEEELLTVSHITGVTRRSEKDVNMFMAESLEGYKVCAAGDLVINTMWAWMGAMGMAPEAGIVSPSYNVYRSTRPDFEPRYYDMLFRTGAFVKKVTCESQGIWTSRLRLYPEYFYEIRIPSPPPEEQREIVKAIDRETGHYNRFRAKIEQSIEMLQEYRTALISAAVTGKIDVSSMEASA